MQPRPEGAAHAGVGAEPLPLCWLQHPSSEYCQADGRAIILQWMTTCLPPLQCSIDELQLDTHCLFDLVLSDPEFEGLLSNLSHSTAVQAVAEAMRVLLSAPAPQVQKTIDMSGIMSTSAVHIPSQCVGQSLVSVYP